MNKVKEFDTSLEEKEESFKDEERKAVMKLLRERHQKHREDVKKLEELKVLKLKTEQEKINFLLEQKDATHKAYLSRRVQSAKYKSKYETEKLKNKIHKVDDFLKKIDHKDKLDELMKKAEKEVEEESKKSKINTVQLVDMISRLYKLNPKDKIEMEYNRKKIEERKMLDKKKMEIRKNEILKMQKNNQDNFEKNDDNQINDQNEKDDEIYYVYNKTKIKDRINKILKSPNKNVFSKNDIFPILKNTDKNYRNPVKLKNFLNNENNNEKYSQQKIISTTNIKKINKSSKISSSKFDKKENLNQTEEYLNLHKDTEKTELIETKKNRPKSAGYKNNFPSENLPNINMIKKEIVAIKKNGFKLEEIENFKRKYKHLDISSLLHQAKMQFIKKTSKNRNDADYLLRNITEDDEDEKENEKLIRKNKIIEKKMYNEAKAKLEDYSEINESENYENEEIEENVENEDAEKQQNDGIEDNFNPEEGEFNEEKNMSNFDNLPDEIEIEKNKQFVFDEEENFQNCANENDNLETNNNKENSENLNENQKIQYDDNNPEKSYKEENSENLQNVSISQRVNRKCNKIADLDDMCQFDDRESNSKNCKENFEVAIKQKRKKSTTKIPPSKPSLNHKLLENFNPKKSYVAACLFNNNELIQAHLLSCRDDEQIVKMLNEKDMFGRKGINYLIINCNLDMIKLNLLSGLILGDTIDNSKRNILHYCTLVDCKELIEVVIRCIVFENKEQLEEMKLYVEKAFLKQDNSKNVQKYQNLPKNDVINLLNNLAESFIEKNLNEEIIKKKEEMENEQKSK